MMSRQKRIEGTECVMSRSTGQRCGSFSLNGVISEQEGFCSMALMKYHRSLSWAVAQVRVLGLHSASFCHTPDSK